MQEDTDLVFSGFYSPLVYDNANVESVQLVRSRSCLGQLVVQKVAAVCRIFYQLTLVFVTNWCNTIGHIVPTSVETDASVTKNLGNMQ